MQKSINCDAGGDPLRDRAFHATCVVRTRRILTTGQVVKSGSRENTNSGRLLYQCKFFFA